MLGASSWLILVFLFGGWTTWLGFLLVGFLVRRNAWIVTGFLYLAAIVAMGVLGPTTQQGILFGGLVYVSGIIAGLIVNQGWLRTLWGRHERGEPWFGRGALAPARRRASARADVPAEAQALLSGPGTSRSDYLADDPPPVPVPAPARRRGRRGRAIDVNKASAADLAALPGIGEDRAAAAISTRNAHPFASTQDFADRIGLQPHEFQQVRTLITYTPITRKGRPGRKLDL